MAGNSRRCQRPLARDHCELSGLHLGPVDRDVALNRMYRMLGLARREFERTAA